MNETKTKGREGWKFQGSLEEAGFVCWSCGRATMTHGLCRQCVVYETVIRPQDEIAKRRNERTETPSWRRSYARSFRCGHDDYALDNE